MSIPEYRKIERRLAASRMIAEPRTALFYDRNNLRRIKLPMLYPIMELAPLRNVRSMEDVLKMQGKLLAIMGPIFRNDTGVLERAFWLLNKVATGKDKDNATPMPAHPTNVARKVVEGNGNLYRFSAEQLLITMAAAALHDSGEDCGLPPKDIAETLGGARGPIIAEIVRLVTHDTHISNGGTINHYGEKLEEIYFSRNNGAKVIEYLDNEENMGRLVEEGASRDSELVHNRSLKVGAHVNSLLAVADSQIGTTSRQLNIGGMVKRLIDQTVTFANHFGLEGLAREVKQAAGNYGYSLAT